MMSRLVVAITAFALCATSASAQTRDTTARRFQLRGDFGSEGELYRISGRDPRRPGESGQLFFNPMFALGPLTVTGNFLLSTDANADSGL